MTREGGPRCFHLVQHCLCLGVALKAIFSRHQMEVFVKHEDKLRELCTSRFEAGAEKTLYKYTHTYIYCLKFEFNLITLNSGRIKYIFIHKAHCGCLKYLSITMLINSINSISHSHCTVKHMYRQTS